LSFFNELKRRNVFRVAIGYIVTAWLLLQFVDLVLENINAPDWVIQVFMLALTIGFPLAVFFAWAFEMTPDGLKRESEVDRSQSITHETGQKLNYTIIGVLVVALGYFAYDKLVLSSARDAVLVEATMKVASELTSTEEVTVESDKSIAVLPFVNMSSDAEQEYFSDGISEEILNSLAMVKELKVAGRTSSFAFKGQNQDLRKIGEALGVEHILEGSVRKAGTTVRITAQLIQVNDGFHLWSGTYDRELNDVFAIQDEIATAILEELKKALIGFETETVVAASARTVSDVYDLYLLARQRIYERKRLSIESAVELLDKAIAKDPNYAPAYAQRGIAALLLSDRNYGGTPRTEAGIQGMLYLEKAVELDPNLAEGWAGIGLHHANRAAGHLEGIEALEKALAINPNLIDASNWLQVIYSESGDDDKALTILEDMVERDPLYPPGYANLINAYNDLGQQEKSWALLERIRPFLPGDPQVLQAEAGTWLSLGEVAKAVPMLESALLQQPSDAVVNNLLGFALMRTGQFEQVIERSNPWLKAFALSLLNRREEAMIIANELASNGFVGSMIYQLYRADEYEKLTSFIESRWTDLAEYESEYPNGGGGWGSMLAIAHAYAKTGNEATFNDAMARVRAAHDHAIEQNIADPFFWADEARYYVMAGDNGKALDLLEQAIDKGMFFPVKFTSVWREMEAIAGEPRFKAVQARSLERVNIERVKLDLEPMTI
jgi:TolB-like protein